MTDEDDGAIRRQRPESLRDSAGVLVPERLASVVLLRDRRRQCFDTATPKLVGDPRPRYGTDQRTVYEDEAPQR